MSDTIKRLITTIKRREGNMATISNKCFRLINVKAKALEKQVEEVTDKYTALLNEENAKLSTIIQDDRIAELREANQYLAKQLESERVKVKELKITDCNCSAEETTGWTTFRLCNICGKIQKK